VTRSLRETIAASRGALGALDRQLRRERRLTPARYGLDYEVLTLTANDGVELAGWWVRASGRRTSSAAVVHHHYGGQKATTLPWIRLLVDLGLDVVSIDGRGHGASSPVRASQGRFDRRALDVRAAVDAAVARGAASVVAVGQSQGAAAVVMAGAADPRIKALVLDSGPAGEPASASWGLAGVTLGRRASAATRASVALYLTWLAGPARYPLSLWRALFRLRNRPLLWLHGDRDRVVPRWSAASWFRALHSPLWHAALVPGGAHLRLLQQAPEQVRAELLDLIAAASPSPAADAPPPEIQLEPYEP